MAKVKAVKKSEAAPAGENPAGRFVINGDNTVTDQKTGLLIIQDPTILGGAFTKTMTYNAALAAIAGLNKQKFLGFDDWRLPTVEEICAMIDRTKHDPCYDTNIFKGRFDDWYWTIENVSWRDGAAWCVSSFSGCVYDYYKSNYVYVRPVRSSQCQFDLDKKGERA